MGLQVCSAKGKLTDPLPSWAPCKLGSLSAACASCLCIVPPLVALVVRLSESFFAQPQDVWQAQMCLPALSTHSFHVKAMKIPRRPAPSLPRASPTAGDEIKQYCLASACLFIHCHWFGGWDATCYLYCTPLAKGPATIASQVHMQVSSGRSTLSNPACMVKPAVAYLRSRVCKLPATK
jgi:hypothetical protein